MRLLFALLLAAPLGALGFTAVSSAPLSAGAFASALAAASAGYASTSGQSRVTAVTVTAAYPGAPTYVPGDTGASPLDATSGCGSLLV